jgi:hypothetical protein
MNKPKYISIATKAYQQACKYEHVTKEQREQLFHFIHDWFRIIEDENRCREVGEETLQELYRKSMNQLHNCDRGNIK